MEVSKRKVVEARNAHQHSETVRVPANDMHSNLSIVSHQNPSDDLETAQSGLPLEGEDLIQTLVTLTGLPEKMANDELNQILDLSGHENSIRQTLTLDELRSAMIAYLETLQPPEEEQDAQ